MRARDSRCAIGATLAAALVACASNPAPQGWRPPAREAQRSTRGGWIVIEPETKKGGPGGKPTRIEGELIAVDAASLHVLTAAGFRTVPRASVRRVAVVGYAGNPTAAGIWAGVGGLSTLSHGAFLILTAPAWILTGVGSVSSEVGAGIKRKGDLAPWARFPQGLPPGLEPASLGPLPTIVVPAAAPGEGRPNRP